MPTFTLTKGETGPSVLVVPIVRAALGGYRTTTGADFDDSIRCDVWPGGSLPVVASPPCEWVEGGVALDFPAEVAEALYVGWFQGRIVLAGDNTPLGRFVLQILPGPGESGSPRPAYHTYEDLLSEFPLVERFADDLHDQTGFAQISAESRDWIEARVTREAWSGRGDCGCGGLYSYACTPTTSYEDALASDSLILDSIEGRRIKKAGVYKTIAMILRRVEGMTNEGGDLVGVRNDYERRAEEELDGCTASFLDSTGLRPIRFGRLKVGRITR